MLLFIYIPRKLPSDKYIIFSFKIEEVSVTGRMKKNRLVINLRTLFFVLEILF